MYLQLLGYSPQCSKIVDSYKCWVLRFPLFVKQGKIISDIMSNLVNRPFFARLLLCGNFFNTCFSFKI